MTLRSKSPRTSRGSEAPADPRAVLNTPDRPARGIVWGLLISIPLFWIPLVLGVLYLLARS